MYDIKIFLKRNQINIRNECNKFKRQYNQLIIIKKNLTLFEAINHR